MILYTLYNVYHLNYDIMTSLLPFSQWMLIRKLAIIIILKARKLFILQNYGFASFLALFPVIATILKTREICKFQNRGVC